jgi:hypothetical protein
MSTHTYTWIGNTCQPGSQTEEGCWHSVPHPHLSEQVKKEGYSIQFPSDQYWHPDYVLFRGVQGQSRGWFVSQRTSGQLAGPFKTKRMAKNWVTADE